jgi:transposase
VGGTCRQLFRALADGRGVARMRRAALRRARGALADLKYARSRRARAEADMIALPGELGVDVDRICQIPGLSPTTVAAILAETGDLRRVACAASLLRWIWSLMVHGTCWDARIAAGQLGHHHAMAA